MLRLNSYNPQYSHGPTHFGSKSKRIARLIEPLGVISLQGVGMEVLNASILGMKFFSAVITTIELG